MNPPDQNDPPAGLLVHEVVHLMEYRNLDPDLQEDVRRFTHACLRIQQLRRTTEPTNIVQFRRRTL